MFMVAWLPSLRSRPQELRYFWNRIFFLRQSTFRPHETSESVHLSRRFYSKGNSHKIKRFNTYPVLVSLLFSFLCFSQSHPKSLPVLPVKTGLRSLRHSLATCHATLLTVMLFRSDTPKPHFFTTALQSGLGPVKMNPGNKLRGFKSVWCKQGLTGHRICLGGPVVVTNFVPCSSFSVRNLWKTNLLYLRKIFVVLP